jgi:hypothetical protein
MFMLNCFWKGNFREAFRCFRHLLRLRRNHPQALHVSPYLSVCFVTCDV